MFWIKGKENRYTPVNPSFTKEKKGFKGVSHFTDFCNVVKGRTISHYMCLHSFQLRLPKSHHIKNSRAICMSHESGWKLVYTGDTRPCQEIITAGMYTSTYLYPPPKGSFKGGILFLRCPSVCLCIYNVLFL